MTIQEMEDRIISEAKAAVGDEVSVRPYPVNPSSYRPPHKTGEVLVRYTGSDYGDRTSDSYAQDKTMKYELVLVFRDLRRLKGSQGAYEALDRLRGHFFDTHLDGANSYCQLSDESFVGESFGLWQWSVSLSFDTVIVSGKIGEVKDINKLKEVNAQ